MSDEEIARAFDGCVLEDYCIREAKKAQMAGVTIEDITKSETELLGMPAKSAPRRQPFGG